jgi:hypothetical protein
MPAHSYTASPAALGARAESPKPLPPGRVARLLGDTRALPPGTASLSAVPSTAAAPAAAAVDDGGWSRRARFPSRTSTGAARACALRRVTPPASAVGGCRPPPSRPPRAAAAVVAAHAPSSVRPRQKVWALSVAAPAWTLRHDGGGGCQRSAAVRTQPGRPAQRAPDPERKLAVACAGTCELRANPS